MRVLLLSLALIMSITTAISGTNEENAIISFEFRHLGTIGGDSHTFKVVTEGDSAKFSTEGMMYRFDDTLSCPMTRQEMEQLNKICADNNILEWDGFNEYDRELLDGSGFTLTIKFSNGKRVNAHGMNSFPHNYRDFTKAMRRLLQPKVNAMLAERQNKMILLDGVERLQHAEIKFYNRDDDKDRYSLEIRRPLKNNNEIEIKVHSATGEFFKIGDTEIKALVNDNDGKLESLLQLIVKHNVTNWEQGDNNDPDNPNGEWFAIDIVFDDWEHIFTRGTLYPDNYKDFRADFLLWLKKLAKKLPR